MFDSHPAIARYRSPIVRHGSARLATDARARLCAGLWSQACAAVVGVVVVGLVGGDALLVEQVGHAAVVAHGEDDEVLIVLGVGQAGEVDAAGPGGGHAEGGGGAPVAGDQAGGGV